MESHISAGLSAAAPAQDGEPHGGEAAPARLAVRPLELVEVVVERNRRTREGGTEVVSARLGIIEIDQLACSSKEDLKKTI